MFRQQLNELKDELKDELQIQGTDRTTREANLSSSVHLPSRSDEVTSPYVAGS